MSSRNNKTIPANASRVPEQVFRNNGIGGIRFNGKSYFTHPTMVREKIDGDGAVRKIWNVEVPVKNLFGFRLADIPADINIIPYEILLHAKLPPLLAFEHCGCCDEVVACIVYAGERTLWPEKIDLGKFMKMTTEAVDERNITVGDVYRPAHGDEGDVVWSRYAVQIPGDTAIDEAIKRVETIAGEIEKVRDEKLSRS
jgi:hypothetical protein